MTYNGTIINNSATIVANAAEDIENGAFLAAKLDSTGLKIATAEDNPIGIFIAETDNIKTGDRATVVVKDICRATVGEAVAAGDHLAAGADGKLMKATSGKFILATALETATEDGQTIVVQICKAGFAAAGE